MQHLKKDHRQKDEVTLRCSLCTIGIGYSKIDNKWHKHTYLNPVTVIYKNKKFLLDIDCFKKVQQKPNLLDKAYFDEYIN